MAVTVDEAGFKGPIALLLDLITQQQIDLWSVSISNLIRDYLQMVQEIAQLDLEDASEFFMVRWGKDSESGPKSKSCW